MMEEIEIDAETYRKTKKKVVEYEKKNYNTIALFPSRGKGQWKKMGDHSALIYYYLIAKPLLKNGQMPRFKSDDDALFRFDIGVVSAYGVDVVRERVKKMGFYKGETNSDGKTVISLTISVTKEQMEDLRVQEMKRRDELNKIIEVDSCYPVLHQKLRLLSTRLHQMAYSQMRKIEGRTNGVQLCSAIDQVIRTYLLALKDKKPDFGKTFETMLEDIFLVLVELQVIADAGIWQIEKCAAVGKMTGEIREMIEEEMRKLKKKNGKKVG